MSFMKPGVLKVDNVFDAKAFNFLDEESCGLLDDTSTQYKVNKANWSANEKYIADYAQAGTILTTPISDEAGSLLEAALSEHLNFRIIRTREWNHTYMFRGAFIPWHEDHHVDLAATFYFQDMNMNCGGLYLYTDNGWQTHLQGDQSVEVKGVRPERNSMLIQHHVPHTVSALTARTPVRRSIQCFFNFAK